MIPVARRAVKRFKLYEKPEENWEVVYTLFLKSDEWKIGLQLPIPGAWIRKCGPISATDIYSLIEAYFKLIKQPWERSHNGV